MNNIFKSILKNFGGKRDESGLKSNLPNQLGELEEKKTSSDPHRIKTAPLSKIKKYIALDIEVIKEIPDFNKWRDHRPLGISCAATLLDGEEPYIWFSETEEGGIANRMSRKDLKHLLMYLSDLVEEGKQILTWNGLGFDFDILAEESGQWEECRTLAINHVDLMFQVFCLKGYPLSLDTAAKGMGMPGKLPGLTAEITRSLWNEGKYQTVFNYVAQDVTATLSLAKTILSRGYLTWTSNSGSTQSVSFPHGLMTVNEAMRLPLPDTSWIKHPINREEFYAWTQNPHPRYSIPESIISIQFPQEKQQNKNFPRFDTDLMDVDAINKVFAAADDHPSLSFIDCETEITTSRKLDRLSKDGIIYCPCPICCGDPSEDPIFKYLYEEDRREQEWYPWDDD